MVRLSLEQGRVTAVLSTLDSTSLIYLELLSGVRGESRQVRGLDSLGADSLAER